VGFSDQVTRLFGSNQPLVAMGRNLGLLGLDLLPPAKRWFARQAMGLGTRPMRVAAHERFGKARLLRWFMNLYPPYLGAGIRVQHISDDFRTSRCAWA
jgi:hypothetical protein